MEVPVEVRARVWELVAEVGLCEFEERAGCVLRDGLMVPAWTVAGSRAFFGHGRLIERICALYRERFGKWPGYDGGRTDG